MPRRLVDRILDGPEDSRKEPITLTRRRVLITFGILAALFVGQGAYTSIYAANTRHLTKENRRLALQGKQAHDGACARKRRLARGVDDTLQFLDAHPKGFAGIAPQIILRGVRRDLEEYDSLQAVICHPKIQEPRRPPA